MPFGFVTECDDEIWVADLVPDYPSSMPFGFVTECDWLRAKRDWAGWRRVFNAFRLRHGV